MRARLCLCLLAISPLLHGAPLWESMVQGKYEQGLAHMKEARGADTDVRHEAYSRAIACFTEARELLLAEIGSDQRLAQAHGQLLADINSCLYWATKFKPLSPEARAAMQEAAGVPKREPPGEEEAARALAVADSYAARCADDPFRAASRYYDVVDGFPGTRAAGLALEKCREKVSAFVGKMPDPAPKEAVPEPESVSVEETREVEKLLKQLEKACRSVRSAQEKGDEIAAELAELQSRAKRIKGGKKATDTKRQEKEALVEHEIPACREKLEKQEGKLARAREEAEEAVLQLERFGARAAPAVDAWVRENGPDREVLICLKKLEEGRDPAPPAPDEPKPARPRLQPKGISTRE